MFMLASCHVLSGKKAASKRLEKNPTLLKSKSMGERQLIINGDIAPGMTRDAVYLAWGNPKHVYEGAEDGVAYEEWHYQTIRPKPEISLTGPPGVEIDKAISKVVRFQHGRVVQYRKKK